MSAPENALLDERVVDEQRRQLDPHELLRIKLSPDDLKRLVSEHPLIMPIGARFLYATQCSERFVRILTESGERSITKDLLHSWLFEGQQRSSVTVALVCPVNRRLFVGVKAWVPLVGAFAVDEALLLSSWAVLGTLIFAPAAGTSLFALWALLLVSRLPLHVWTAYASRDLPVRTGIRVRQKVLDYWLRQPKSEGITGATTRVFEADAVDSTLAIASYQLCIGIVEVLATLGIFVLATSLLPLMVFVGWLVLSLVVLWRFYYGARQLADSRLHLSAVTLEELLGHETKLAQLEEEEFSRRYRRTTEAYVKHLDLVIRRNVQLNGFRRSWFLIGIIASLPQLTGEASTVQWAMVLGGVLLGQRGVTHLLASAEALVATVLAMRHLRSELTDAPNTATEGHSPRFEDPLVFAEQVTVYRGSRRVLRDVSIQLKTKDRVLLTGPSGSGKSTLAHTISLSTPVAHGRLKLGGYDAEAVPASAWREECVVIPQFGSNHIFVGPLAYNVLLGRGWPPSDDDLLEAEKLLNGLGLGDLLDRMPDRMHQMIGEGGWGLSYGERCRVFLARGILQEPRILIIDETIDGLDPYHRFECLQVLQRHVTTLILITQTS